MPISVTGATDSGQGGFTLIELLIVLVIMGLAVALVTLSVRAPNQIPLQRQAEQLAAVLEVAADEVSLTGAPVLLILDHDGWRFLQQTQATGWENAPQERLPPGRFSPRVEHLVQVNVGQAEAELDQFQFELGAETLQPLALRLQRQDQQTWLRSDGLGHFWAAP